MVNIIFGIVFVVGGLTNTLALRGTNSSAALVVVGFLMIGFGIFRLSRRTN